MIENVDSVLGVVVVNYNSTELLHKHLATADFAAGTHVVVVDNSEVPSAKAELRVLAAGHRWHLIDAGRNRGFGAAVNLGAAYLLDQGCSSLLLLNPDAAIARGDLDRLLQIQRECPRAILSPRIRRADGTLWFTGAELRMHAGEAVHSDQGESPPHWLTAACLLMTRDVWLELDGIDEDYFLYWEDVDLTYRWRQRGGELRVVASATATHDVGATQQNLVGKSTIFLFYNSRNRLLFAAKTLGLWRTLLWALCTPKYVWRMLERARFRRAPEHWSSLRAIVCGTCAGLGLALVQLVRPARRRIGRELRRGGTE